MMGIYYFFVSIVLERGGENYHLFILTGIVAWQYFTTTLLNATKVVENNLQLIKQVALPIPMLITIPVLVQMIFAVFGMGIIMVWNFEAIGFHSILVIPLLILTGMVSYGFGLYVSVINVYFSDTSQILNYVLRMGFFLSPILFPAERILNNEKLPSIFKILFQINPMGVIISSFRDVLLEGKVFDINIILVLTAIVICIIQLGLMWVRANSSQIVKML